MDALLENSPLTRTLAGVRRAAGALDARLCRRSPHGREGGVALVEFALVLPLLLILLLGMLDFGRAFNYWIDETQISHEAARWAAVNRNPGPGGTLQQSIRQRSDTVELRDGGSDSIPNPLQVCVSFPAGTSNVGDPVKVTVTTTYNFLSFVGAQTGVTQKQIAASSTMRLEARPTNLSAGCA
jgi:Flp pilus assembly protein TadG